MNISYNWLKEFIDLDLSPDELKERLTFSGIEVESVHKTGELLNQIVIGEIVHLEKHPEADKLTICDVFDGTATHRVVCGANNCVLNGKIAFAPVGTDFGDFKLKKAKLRGVESNGMICSERELGISDEHDGIMVLPSSEASGKSLAEYTGLSDVIYEVEITPNRSDLLGMIGIARDLSAQMDIPLKEPCHFSKTVGNAFIRSASGTENDTVFPKAERINAFPTDGFCVQINEPDLCTRYIAVRFTDLKVAPSPKWLVDKLVIAGIKPINNIVDITNYVMYVYGHPLHAFDEKCINGNKIIVRKSYENEIFPALDNRSYTLTGNELVIADSEKAVALAGVIGGKNSHITDETTSIVLEAACFNSSITRRTSHNLKIFTDSSYRFERGMCEETCQIIASKATELILELAGGKVVQQIDVYPVKKEPVIVKLRPERVKKLLSITLDNHKIISYLKNLGLKFLNADADALYFEIPPFRIDLTREIDLIEEIIRLHGFDSVEKSIPEPQIMNRQVFYARRNVKNLLVNNGFYEAVNITFTDPSLLDLLKLAENDPRRNTVKILNPQGESFSILRSCLIPQLLKNVLFNLHHGNEDLKLFEMNKVFFGHVEQRNISDSEILHSVQNDKKGVQNDKHCHVEERNISNRLPSESWRLTGLMLGKYTPIHWKEKSENITYTDIKGIIEAILNLYKINKYIIEPSEEPFYLPNSGFSVKVKYPSAEILGTFGRLDKKVLEDFEIEKDVYLFDLNLDKIFSAADFSMKPFTEISKYPVVSRDLSFIIKEEFLLDEIIKSIKETNPKTIKNVVLFDQFKGKQIKEGFRSLSINISLSSETKTLTDDQIKSIIDRIIDKLKEKFHIEMR